jgi:hypothetical protein
LNKKITQAKPCNPNPDGLEKFTLRTLNFLKPVYFYNLIPILQAFNENKSELILPPIAGFLIQIPFPAPNGLHFRFML